MAGAKPTDGSFPVLSPTQALEFTGERMTSAVDGQIEFEHLHRYCLARDHCLGKDVLDVASGEGYGSAILAGVARSVIGVDIDEISVAHARGAYRSEGLLFLQGSAIALPVQDSSIDVVVSFETLEHIREHERFAVEVKRVLRPGGTFIVSTPDRAIYSARGEHFNKYHVLELTEPEFGSFLRLHFIHAIVLHQRAVFGSIIASPAGPDWRSFERRIPEYIEASGGLTRAPYLIGVASDAELPDVASSAYFDRRSVFEATDALLQAPAALARAAERERERDAARAAMAEKERHAQITLAQANARSSENERQARATLADTKRQAHAAHADLLSRLRHAEDEHVAQLARLKRREVNASLPPTLRGWSALVPGRRRKLQGLARNYRLVASSPLFDAPWYLTKNPDVAAANLDPVSHYLSFGDSEGRAPGPHFDNSAYLAANPDVAATNINALVHYLLRGCNERRNLAEEPKPQESREASTPAVADSNEEPELEPEPEREDYYSHRLNNNDVKEREWQGYQTVKTIGDRPGGRSVPRSSSLDFCKSLEGADLCDAASHLDFKGVRNASEAPFVSIIIPSLNQQRHLAECLASIDRAAPFRFAVEIIVSDNASSDALFGVLDNIGSVRVLRFASELGHGEACNKAVEIARGEYLFLLNDTAQIAPGCLETLVDALTGAGNGNIGIVGPKILSLDGRLQEAGCLLGSNGVGTLIGFGNDPSAGRFNYDRFVDHVSGAAVLIRRSLFIEIGGFDPIFAPTYCEYADLTLKVRDQGLCVKYVAGATAAHHLSVTSNSLSSGPKLRRIARNRNILVKSWIDRLAQDQLKTIAIYLPQFHSIPENDLWWGKGFTEWTNVAKASPNYRGHEQPRHPTDLGYYDLRVPEVLEAQAALAKRYGIHGFCYYYYWFSGKRLLETPLEQMLASGKPDFPFCLCWANENWTRAWDGQNDNVLLGQDYSPDHNREVIADIARYFRAPSYIRINGRPLVLVYRIQELKDAAQTVELWRDYCRETGVGEICLAIVETFTLAANPVDPAVFGCDLAVEFPAHFAVDGSKLTVEQLNPEWTGEARDYRALAKAFMSRDEKPFTRLRSVLTGWDNTPRRQNGSVVLEGATPGAFQAWLEWTYQRTLEQNYGDERIVFINAWNEWCEGAYLEPDRRFGHAYLQAVSNALESVREGGYKFVEE
jgi:O-antigen biosynthesis protein